MGCTTVSSAPPFTPMDKFLLYGKKNQLKLSGNGRVSSCTSASVTWGRLFTMGMRRQSSLVCTACVH